MSESDQFPEFCNACLSVVVNHFWRLFLNYQLRALATTRTKRSHTTVTHNHCSEVFFFFISSHLVFFSYSSPCFHFYLILSTSNLMSSSRVLYRLACVLQLSVALSNLPPPPAAAAAAAAVAAFRCSRAMRHQQQELNSPNLNIV
jgi:hypothetical protein